MIKGFKGLNELGFASKAELIAVIKELEFLLSGLGVEDPTRQKCEARIIELCHQLRNLDQVEVLTGDLNRALAITNEGKRRNEKPISLNLRERIASEKINYM